MSVIGQIQLHLLTDHNRKFDDNYLKFLESCMVNGITDIQLRNKKSSRFGIATFAAELRSLTRKHNVRLIINDHPEIALDVEADGVHLGQNDLHPDIARDILGPSKIIGLSIENIQQLESANLLDSVTYVAAGSIFPTTSKPDVKTIWGIDGLYRFCQHSRHPVIAIGGISLENLTRVLRCNVNGVAIISAIHEAADPIRYICEIQKQAEIFSQS